MQEWIDKIRAVWGYTEEELGTMKVDNFLQDGDIAMEIIASSPREFQASTSQEMSQIIKPFMDSTTMTHGGTELRVWPLVDHVELYVRSPILANGVELVDLPGQSDAIESRAQIARRFSENLAASIIVTPIVRAADEKVAVSLLSENQALNMQLEGKLNSKSYCVAVTKTDDLDPVAYLKPINLERGPDKVNKNKLSKLEKEYPGLRIELREAQARRNVLESRRRSNGKFYQSLNTTALSRPNLVLSQPLPKWRSLNNEN